MAKILNLIHKSLSDLDLKKILGSDLKIIEYSDLAKYNSLYELLPSKRDYCVILYVDKTSSSTISGHWTALTRDGNQFTFFDSYGLKPDAELHWINLKKRMELKEYDSYLTNLLQDVDYCYNPIRFQSSDHDASINTCGSHVAMFLWYFKNHNMNLEQYQEYINYIKFSTKLPFDAIVADFVSEHLK